MGFARRRIPQNREMNSDVVTERSYWYTDAEDRRSTSVTEALRGYRAAETAMRRRTRQSMDMGENELLMLRYLSRARTQGETVTTADLTRYLAVPPASTRVLIDRLERSGHVALTRTPDGAAAVTIASTDSADAEIRHTLGAMHDRMARVVRGMSDEDRAVVIGFLDAMRDAVDEIEAQP